MKEREVFIQDELLASDYWEGHGLQDSCRPKEDRIVRDFDVRLIGKTNRLGERILKEFLTSSNERLPIRTFLEGELFETSEYSAGTVVRFNREHMTVENGEPWYMNKDLWGVILQSEKDEKKRVLVAYHPMRSDEGMASKPYFHPGLDYGREIKIARVDHVRYVTSKNTVNSLSRTNFLQVFESGQIVRQEKKRRSFSSVFQTRTQNG